MRPAILLAATAATAAAATLFDTLSATRFFSNNGTVRAGDEYTWRGIPCMYLEAQNVSCAQCSWGDGGACPYLYQVNGTEPSSCTPQAPAAGLDEPGSDYAAEPLDVDDHTVCQAHCCAESQCVTWTYVPSAPADFMGCKAGDHCCFKKGGSPASKASDIPGIISGNVTKPDTGFIAPPLGMRSSVPLGGLGAGAVELRADGTFHEVTIQNQSPAGAAKYGTLADALVALRVAPSGGGAAVSKLVRTQPPGYAPAASGLSAITYSGTHPVSRLTLQDAALPVAASLYAYSTLKPGDMAASGAPAVAFTLAVTNPSAAAVDVSLLLTLPFPAINDCARKSKAPLSAANATSAAACLHACAATPAAGASACASWTWQAGPSEGSGTCTLAPDVPWSVFQAGASCGVRGTWSADGEALTLVANPAGGAGGPANGDLTLQPVVDGATSAVSVAVADSPSALLTAFWGAGAFNASQAGIAAAGTFYGASAAVGGAAVTTSVAAGATATLSIVWAWYFPDRDHMNVNIGNHYATVYDSSAQVAQSLAAPGALAAVAADINAHHAVFAGPPAGSGLPQSPLPEWLADFALNAMSHFRGLIWTRDGRIREFEANDCPDVDSVHNDYQRHLPYLWLLPEFEEQKNRIFAAGAEGDGHIDEYLGSFNLGPLDVPGGRTMADTTTLWIVQLLELFHNSGDMALLQQQYPHVVRAIEWQIAASAKYGLPANLVCTYDIPDFQQYDTYPFAGFLHLAAMRAGAAIATLLNDTATAAAAEAAFQAGVAATGALLWNETVGYFRGYTGGDAIMSDCLYGQVVALHHGLGWMVETANVSAHLANELKYNGNGGGLYLLSGRSNPGPAEAAAPAALGRFVAGGEAARARAVAAGRERHLPHDAAAALSRAGKTVSGPFSTIDDVNWLGAGPTWSYLQLRLGAMSIDEALAPSLATVANFRTRLNDWWNFVGITTSGDWGSDAANYMPYVTSHYGFLLPAYYLVPQLTGQLTDLPAGALSFAPAYACPYTLPLLLAGTTGTISCTGATPAVYTAAIAFGALQLPPGGLSVSGVAYPLAVSLAAGDSITWHA